MDKFDFATGAALIGVCEENGITVSEAMIRREIERSQRPREEIVAQMAENLRVMNECVQRSQQPGLKIMGGFIGGESQKLSQHIRTHGAMGGMISRAAAYAMGVIEVNASMGRIVAAPTAGSSGVIPGVLIAAKEEYDLDDGVLIDALFNAGAIGYLIARNATVSGAEGGCQAEVGAASAMAASALCQIMGGSVNDCLSAAGDAISNILGLVCDPICGLVEAPCQKRNAMGVANAVISAEIALATCRTLIPFDEVVHAMRSVGKSIPYQLRETALGGLAKCPSVKHGPPAQCSDCDECE